MTVIVVSDTHFSDRPQDEYRWGLWPWLREQIKKFQIDEVLHLGDLTEAKDRHPSRLVNRLIESMVMLIDQCPVHLLKGNHDYIDPYNPFFGFVDNYPDVTYYKVPAVAELSIGKATFIPAGTEWNFKPYEFPYLFTHVTFDGAEAENGSLLPGVDPAKLRDYKGMVYSGDIHVPQKIRKNIEYVGAPYHIRFGDRFSPRVLVIFDNGKTSELQYPAPFKFVFDLNSLNRFDTITGDARSRDHVKIRYHLHRADYHTWHETRDRLRKLAAEREWELFGIEPVTIQAKANVDDRNTHHELLTSDQMFDAYAKKHKLTDDYVRIGRELLKP